MVRNSQRRIYRTKKKQVAFFKKKFENLSTQELKNKMNENLVDEAKKAINEIITERNN